MLEYFDLYSDKNKKPKKHLIQLQIFLKILKVKLYKNSFVPEQDGSRFRHPEHLEINTRWNDVLTYLQMEIPPLGSITWHTQMSYKHLMGQRIYTFSLNLTGK